MNHSNRFRPFGAFVLALVASVLFTSATIASAASKGVVNAQIDRTEQTVVAKLDKAARSAHGDVWADAAHYKCVTFGSDLSGGFEADFGYGTTCTDTYHAKAYKSGNSYAVVVLGYVNWETWEDKAESYPAEVTITHGKYVAVSEPAIITATADPAGTTWESDNKSDWSLKSNGGGPAIAAGTSSWENKSVDADVYGVSHRDIPDGYLNQYIRTSEYSGRSHGKYADGGKGSPPKG